MNDTETDPVIGQLEDLGIAHEVIPCDPSLADTSDFCAAYAIDPSDSVNAILVAGKVKSDEKRPFALCLVLATHRLDVNGMVRKRLGSRKASFASAEETVAITGMEIGGVTPFGMPSKSKIPIWIDTSVLARDRVVVGGGTRTCKLLIPADCLPALPGAEVVDGLATAIIQQDV